MKINAEEITAVLQELYKITGFRISLHSTDYEELAAYPSQKLEFCRRIQETPCELKKCEECDRAACEKALKTKSTVIYTCRHGLVEAVSPLYDYDTLAGYLMMGQVLAAETEEDTGFFKENHSAKELDIPTVKPEMVNSYIHIMTICAKYLTFSNAVQHENATLAKLAKAFIHDNIQKKITIKTICSALKCSKTSLLVSFKREYGTTLNAYITEQRLALAEKLLSGESSLNEIARAVGFSDQSYFSKVFSTKYGIPPSEYAQKITKEQKNAQGSNKEA